MSFGLHFVYRNSGSISQNAPTLDHTDQDHNDCQNQQNVDQASKRGTGHEAQRP